MCSSPPPLLPVSLRSLACALGLCWLLATPVSAGLVINEIFYHAPDDLTDLQWIELCNPDSQPVNVSDWHFTRGIEYKFPPNSIVPAGGFVVLCKKAKLFAEYYDVKADGVFKKSLGRSHDTLELVDAAGRTIDRVTYGDRAPWPAEADGVSSSLERITPKAPGDRPENWAASPLPGDRERPMGTPGRVNANYSANLPPVIRDLTFTPRVPVPGQPVKVRVTVEGGDGAAAVELRYRVAGPGKLGEEERVAMQAAGGQSFTGEIPGVESLHLLRVRVRAVDAKQAERFFPSPHGLRPAVSLFVPPPVDSPNLAMAYMVNTDPAEMAEMERIRLRMLQPDRGPRVNRDRQRLEKILREGLDVPAAFFECTINQPVDHATYRQLRTIFLAAKAERHRIITESLAVPDVAAEAAAAAKRIQDFHAGLIAKVKKALPAAGAAAFESWSQNLVERATSDQRPSRRWINFAGEWFALNEQAEFTAEQVGSLRSDLQAAARKLQEQIAGRRLSFEESQKVRGEIFETLNQQLREQLSVRQWHALADWRGAQASPIRPRLLEPPPRSPRGQTAFVVVSPKTGEVEVFDYLHITERSAGYRVRFHKDQPWRDMTSTAVIFENNDRSLLAEPLAFELYRRVGNASCQTDFVRLSVNGHLLGYQLVLEQVNGGFLRRNQLDSTGDLYKLLWYGNGLSGQHEKQNHPDRTHADLRQLVTALNTTSGDAQWALIQANFDVDQVINYFAVNLVLSHWDGFFNNYFVFQDRKASGKWTMYAWDQDNTWGTHDSAKSQTFFDMPVTFGMQGDRPPGGGEPVFNPGHWWRPGGYFSKPLLANREFRQRYLQRVRQIVDETYTEKTFFPIIDAMAERLRAEIPIRAKVVGEAPDQALARLDRNVASLKDHLVKRRQFLLEQAEIKALPR